MKGFFRRDQSGFTLVEILVAVAILMIGLVAVMQLFPMGTAGVETGRRQSTGVFLAEQRIEQIKAFGLSTVAGQGFAAIPICNPCVVGPAPFIQENFSTIPGYPEYSRRVFVTCPTAPFGGPCPTATTRLVRVQVGYQRVTSTGVFGAGTQVDIATLIAQH